MNLKKFVQENQFDINDTHEWINFIHKFITEYDLQSMVSENENGSSIYINSQEEYQLLEDLLYEVEEEKTTLNYIFENNIEYGEDYYE